MKAVAAVITALALSGCATTEQNILAGAAIGAVIGSEISRQQQHPHEPVIIHRPAPVIIHQPWPIHCHYRPWYDQWGYYRGEQRLCR